jgi:hypothetical protein
VIGVAYTGLRLYPWNLIWVIPAKGMSRNDPHHIIDQAAFRWKRLFLLSAGLINDKAGEISHAATKRKSST